MKHYTNVKDNSPHMVFIGRWCPFHKGHAHIMEKKMKENPGKPILVLVRDTDYDALPTPFRADLVKAWMQEKDIPGTVMIIPDIEGVYWSRKVGYTTEAVDVDESIANISATDIRRKIKEGDDSWKDHIPAKGAADMIERELR
ncbi:MAG: hypothetical protein KJ709_04285 [Nanoarchaeota archaeon]|nr:hypothetical protein [Nanoarchaeota archaeon]